MTRARSPETTGRILDVDTFAVHDGPGIRLAVYLKGCPLRCSWCHSPESQARGAQLVFIRDRCSLCGACETACPTGAHVITGGSHEIDRQACTACGACADNCPSEALVIKGVEVRAGEIVARAVRMRPFFEHSGGGITLTGGEVTDQPQFAAAILDGCRREGIHTAIETAGPCAREVLEELADLTDLVLFDLKLMDEALHKRHVGASNAPILENARMLASRANVQIRLPLIPGITDTDENVSAVVAFMLSAGLDKLGLLPYNPATAAKYEWLGRRYCLEGASADDGRASEILLLATDAGLSASLI